MATRTKAKVRETVHDVMMVSSFGFWAIMIGFMPIATIHFLAS